MTKRTLIGVGAGAKDSITTTSSPQGGWKYSTTDHHLYDLAGKRSTPTVVGGVCCTSRPR